MLVGMSMRPASRQRWTQRKTNGAPLAFLVMQRQFCMPSPCLATWPVAKKTKVMRHESIWILILLLETWLQMVYISLHVVYLTTKWPECWGWWIYHTTTVIKIIHATTLRVLLPGSTLPAGSFSSVFRCSDNKGRGKDLGFADHMNGQQR